MHAYFLFHIWDLKHDQTNLLKVIAWVNAGLDLPLLVELKQLGHSPVDELLISDVAQVEAADGLVGLHQFEGGERELVGPGFCHGQQVLLLACHTIGRT